MIHKYDVVIVGAGGAGLRAALEAKLGGASVAVVSKIYPTRSHTSAAQGGVGAALGNEEPDSWEWHMYDTIKGGDYLGDQDAIAVMTKDAIRAVYELEHLGLPFSRTAEGKIAQRPFGGHTRDYGKAPVKRACYSADRTGHMILHTLYENCVKERIKFYPEFLVTELLFSETGGKKKVIGLTAMNLATGEVDVFNCKAVLFATGGYGRAFRVTSNAYANTGDGMSLAYKAGVPLEDMEFVQFHPTGLYKLGILVTEGARGEGGILYNDKHERFMERYAPTIKDLAPRDMVSRSIYMEIREGRGIGGKDFVNLDITMLGAKKIEEKLPDIASFSRIYLGVDPAKEPIPVAPTAHYAMGGIPTDADGRVVIDERNTPLPGFYSAGEAACVSVHGANRLGTNSLLDIIVFGKRSGAEMARYCKTVELEEIYNETEYVKSTKARIDEVISSTGTESAAAICKDLQNTMMDHVSVFRTEQTLTTAMNDLKNLKDRYAKVKITDKGKVFNFDLTEALELEHLLNISEAIVVGALERKESRGAHAREDYQSRDDANYLKHTLIYKGEGKAAPKISFKPVFIYKDDPRFKPKERKY